MPDPTETAYEAADDGYFSALDPSARAGAGHAHRRGMRAAVDAVWALAREAGVAEGRRQAAHDVNLALVGMAGVGVMVNRPFAVGLTRIAERGVRD
jgi:hypothetical protein